MLGTDYPFPLGEVSGFAGAFPGKAIQALKDDGLQKKLLFDNAAKFLSLDENQFSL